MKSRQGGFSLVEVLVTMLLMSIGLLGIAGIITTSLRNNQSSYAQSQASLLANDIVERMRANRAVAEKSSAPYALGLTATAPTGSSVPETDLREWRTLLSQSMPSGTGSVAFDTTSGDVTVTIQWDDSRSTSDGSTVGLTNQTLVLETHL